MTSGFMPRAVQGPMLLLLGITQKKEVPITTLEQAAMLAGLASYQRDSDYAEVIGTEVRYVKKEEKYGPWRG